MAIFDVEAIILNSTSKKNWLYCVKHLLMFVY